jgi:hypothetical protein
MTLNTVFNAYLGRFIDGYSRLTNFSVKGNDLALV